MALVKNPPNTILLGGGLPGGDGGHTIVEEYIAGVRIIPGMLVEKYKDTDNKMKLRPHASAGEVVTTSVALEKTLFNKGVDDAYEIGELVREAHLRKGSTWWALVPSGQDISSAEFMQSNGDGRLKSASATTATANVAQFQALEAIGAVNADTRLRTVVI